MRRPLLLLLLPTLLAAPASACLWDRDTLDVEGKEMPETVAILTGRFERQPERYYRMRLERVSRELASHPERLSLYDDAGVAADRLQQSDQAVTWMRRKRSAMARFTATPGDRYRYHANLGTFLAHGWLRKGAKAGALGELKAARAEIAAAIKINPDAHFGREKYQLALMDWLLAQRTPGKEDTPLGRYLTAGETRLVRDDASRQAAIRGLCGLVALGNAWESVDVFEALKRLFHGEEKASLGLLAGLRAVELMDAGRLPVSSFVRREDLSAPNALPGPLASLARSKFRELRAEAEAWHAVRTQFMEARLAAGRHPDTDPTFWDGYQSAPAPKLEPSPLQRLVLFVQTPHELAQAVLPMLIMILGFFAVRRFTRRRTSPAT